MEGRSARVSRGLPAQTLQHNPPALIRRQIRHSEIVDYRRDDPRMGRSVRDRPGRPGRRQLQLATYADHEPLLNRVRKDALRLASR